jgi:hypothetical protein
MTDQPLDDREDAEPDEAEEPDTAAETEDEQTLPDE